MDTLSSFGSLGGILLLDLHDVSHPDLRGIVDNVFIVLQCKLPLLLDVALVVVDDRPVGDLDAVGQRDGVLVAGASLAAALHTVEGVLQLLHELGLVQLLGLAQHHLAHEHQVALLLAVAAGCVLETLVEHICEVDSLAEHVACCGGFRWRNLETLTEEADEVEHHRAVVEKVVVRHLLERVDNLGLSLALYLEYVCDFKLISLVLVVVDISRVVDVCADDLILGALHIECLNHEVHGMIDVINRVHLLLSQQCTE